MSKSEKSAYFRHIFANNLFLLFIYVKIRKVLSRICNTDTFADRQA